ncbi:hypothetical protein [Rhizobium sp. Leaf383]|uniref:hypothetical protein n=1 Tax=Rhizobium sp. Leaf383 TaxID=1736357 RepID=UPI0012E34D2C|nr:hypothetical protein [Rhizobium sp. Leaf383]
MSTLDGSSLSIPGFTLVPDVTDEEQEEAIAAREEFWPREPINGGIELHAAFPFQLIPPPPASVRAALAILDKAPGVEPDPGDVIEPTKP